MITSDIALVLDKETLRSYINQ